MRHENLDRLCLARPALARHEDGLVFGIIAEAAIGHGRGGVGVGGRFVPHLLLVRFLQLLGINVEPVIGIHSDANVARISVGQLMRKAPPQVVQNGRLVKVIEMDHIVHSALL